MALQCKAPPPKPTPRPPPYPPTAANLACEQRLVAARAELKKASVAAMGGGGGGGGFRGGDKRARLMATLARAAVLRAKASDPEEKTKKSAKPPKPIGLQRVTSASRSSPATKEKFEGPKTSDPEEKTKKSQAAGSDFKPQPLRMTSATRSSPIKRKAASSSDPSEKTKKLTQNMPPGSVIEHFLL